LKQKGRGALVVLFDMKNGVKYSFSKFDRIPQEPGCYVWVLDWSRILSYGFDNLEIRIELLQTIQQLYSPNPISVKANRVFLETQQQFGEEYLGTLRISNQTNIIEDITVIAKEKDLTMKLLTILSEVELPLYIGKSNNVYSRIQQHKSIFEEIPFLDSSDVEIQQIKIFGDRIKMLFNNNSLLQKQILSVIIYQLPQNEVLSFEKYLNLIYKPILGIK
jgi:hypothetical protein